MTAINSNDMTNFFLSKVHAKSISIDDATKLGLDVDKLENADTDKDGKLSMQEIEVDKDLYSDFASMILGEEKTDKVEPDKEKEKEKKNQIKDKNGAGI